MYIRVISHTFPYSILVLPHAMLFLTLWGFKAIASVEKFQKLLAAQERWLEDVGILDSSLQNGKKKDEPRSKRRISINLDKSTLNPIKSPFGLQIKIQKKHDVTLWKKSRPLLIVHCFCNQESLQNVAPKASDLEVMDLTKRPDIILGLQDPWVSWEDRTGFIWVLNPRKFGAQVEFLETMVAYGNMW